MPGLATHVSELETLLEIGSFTSTAEAYVNSIRTSTNPNSHYAKLKNEEGVEVAEKWLENRTKNRVAFGDSIEPTVRGIVDLGRVRPDLVLDISSCIPLVPDLIDPRFGRKSKYVVFNEQAPGCGCSQPAGSYTFGPYGQLGLSAVIVEHGYDSKGPKSMLTLIMSTWGTSEHPPREGAYSIVKLENDGYDQGERHDPYIRTDDGAKPFTDRDAMIKHLLGINPLGENVSASAMSCGANEVMGFPDAEKFLALNMPFLGKYFTSLAEKLSTNHSH